MIDPDAIPKPKAFTQDAAKEYAKRTVTASDKELKDAQSAESTAFQEWLRQPWTMRIMAHANMQIDTFKNTAANPRNERDVRDAAAWKSELLESIANGAFFADTYRYKLATMQAEFKAANRAHELAAATDAGQSHDSGDTRKPGIL